MTHTKLWSSSVRVDKCMYIVNFFLVMATSYYDVDQNCGHMLVQGFTCFVVGCLNSS